MIDALLWLYQEGTTQIVFQFVDNNWIVLWLALGALKIIAKRTKNTVDDSLYELFKYAFDSVRSMGKSAVTGVASGTVKVAKSVASKNPWKDDPSQMAANH